MTDLIQSTYLEESCDQEGQVEAEGIKQEAASDRTAAPAEGQNRI